VLGPASFIRRLLAANIALVREHRNRQVCLAEELFETEIFFSRSLY
jgi:hypothetical protein